MAEKHFDMERIKKSFQRKCVIIPDTVDDLHGYENPIQAITRTIERDSSQKKRRKDIKFYS